MNRIKTIGNNNNVTKNEIMSVWSINNCLWTTKYYIKREQSGITLIALVITIIVLLILSAVTINLTLRRKRNI